MMERVEFAKIMVVLGAGVGKEPTSHQIEVYFDLLGDLPVDALRFAAKQALLESSYPVIPAVGILRRLAVESMTPRALCPMEAWELVRTAIRHYGYMREREGLASLPPTVAKAARAIGWQSICDSENPETVRAQFRQAYEPIATDHARLAALPAQMRDKLDELRGDPAALPGAAAQRLAAQLGGNLDEGT